MKFSSFIFGKVITGLLLILTLICNKSELFAQSSLNGEIVPKSFAGGPNTNSTARFNDYTVSYVSGIPSIDYTLFNIPFGEKSIPIHLSFNTQGHRISDVPGMVGLGASISFGGDVRRSIQGGIADESGSGFLRNPIPSNINPNLDSDLQFLDGVYFGNIDAEPDIFSFSANGDNGKFFFDRSNNFEPAMLPLNPCKLIKKFNATTGKLSFELRNTDGDRFFYGDSIREYTSGSNGGVNFGSTSAWMLEKIKTSDGRDSVSYNYVMQNSISLEDFSEAWGVDDSRNVVGSDPDASAPAPSLFAPNSTAFLTSVNYSSNTTEYLPKEIYFKNGKVLFNYSSLGRQDFRVGFHSAKSLNSIEIYYLDYRDDIYRLQKKIQFYQSYFQSGSDSLSRRLRLDSIRFFDGNNTYLEHYVFGYNSQALPNRSSKMRDYWGFYNGMANNTLIPRITIPYSTGVGGAGTTVTIGSNIEGGREPDSIKSQASILKSIITPTGAVVNFEYESNKYDDNGTVKLAGGLRIKSIRTYDPYTNSNNGKYFKYGLDENGLGKKNFSLENFNFIITQGHKYWYNFSGMVGLMVTKNTRTIVSSPNIDIAPYDEAYVIYPVVTEYIDSLGKYGKSVMRFTDQSDALTSAAVAKPVKNSYFYARGQLLNKKIYRNEGGQYILKQEDAFRYQAFNEVLYPQSGLVVNKTSINEGAIDGTIMPSSSVKPSDANNFRYSYYSINSGEMLPTYFMSKVYDDNNSSMFHMTIRSFDYKNISHQEITNDIQITSEGDTIINRTKYASDYLVGNSTGSVVLDSIVTRNIVKLPIEQITYKIDSGSTIKKVLAGQVFYYKIINGGKDLVLDKTAMLVINQPIVNYIDAKIVAGVFQVDSRYVDLTSYSYNASGRAIYIASKTNPPRCVFWDYKDQYQTAEVENAMPGDVAYASFETDNKGNWSYSGLTAIDTTAPGGFKSYNLGQSNGNLTLSGLSSSKVYYVSYWIKGNTSLSIPGTTGSVLKGSKSYGAWNYFAHYVTGVSGITISGSGIIDELRLHPKGARMTTMSFLPNIGVVSKIDDNGNVSRYGYDAAGRCKWIREFKNLVKTFTYSNNN